MAQASEPTRRGAALVMDAVEFASTISLASNEAADTHQVLGGRYRIERVIGSGSFGTVFEAIDERLDKAVAIKLLASQRAGDPSIGDRFRAEGRALSRLAHPNLVAVTDYDVLPDGRPMLVMELARGRTLDRVMTDEGPLELERAIEVLSAVCSGLEAAHAAGVVHRDLKPANIMIDTSVSPPTVKILDFGIAKITSSESDHSLTGTGEILGTPVYMAPEQVRASIGPIDGRADIYAACTVLYEMVTGARPFDEAGGVAEVLVARLFEEPVPPSRRRSELPAVLDDVIGRGLARCPHDRYASASDLATALSGIAASAPAAPPRRRRRGLVAAAVAMPLLGLAAWLAVPRASTQTDSTGRYAAALHTRLAAYEDAARVESRAAALYERGAARERAGDYARCAAVFDRVARETVAPELRRDARQRADSCRARQPGRLEIRATPADAQLYVVDDGGARTPIDAQVELAPGSYEVVAEADGHAPASERVTVVRGETGEVELSLERKRRPRKRRPIRIPDAPIDFEGGQP